MNTERPDLIQSLAQTGCFERLRDDGFDLTPTMTEQLEAYVALVRQWNPFASLVSLRDAESAMHAHLADSLSLVRYVAGSRAEEPSLLDIGSGGGLPAIPIKILLPMLPLTLIERSERKVGFLRQVIARLHLEEVTLVHGEFPVRTPEHDPTVITARGVEKADRVVKAIGAYLPDDAVFLCQPGQKGVPSAAMFHVERVEDAWAAQHVRRGDLFLLTRP